MSSGEFLINIKLENFNCTCNIYLYITRGGGKVRVIGNFQHYQTIYRCRLTEFFFRDIIHSFPGIYNEVKNLKMFINLIFLWMIFDGVRPLGLNPFPALDPCVTL